MTFHAGIKAPLFVPADRPERFSKAAGSGADAVILDLEDAVVSVNKDQARAKLAVDFTHLPVIVRVNDALSAWHKADLERVRDLGPGAVMLPKAKGTDMLEQVARDLGPQIAIVALVECAQGIANARTMAASGHVARLAFGSIDYCADLSCAHSRDALLWARGELVLASRLAGLESPIDGVTANVSDPDLAYDDAAYARSLGFSGKLCVHPRQIAPVKRAFAPSEKEIDWAMRVLAATHGAARVDGEMVDKPVRLRARAILAEAGRNG